MSPASATGRLEADERLWAAFFGPRRLLSADLITEVINRAPIGATLSTLQREFLNRLTLDATDDDASVLRIRLLSLLEAIAEDPKTEIPRSVLSQLVKASVLQFLSEDIEVYGVDGYHPRLDPMLKLIELRLRNNVVAH